MRSKYHRHLAHPTVVSEGGYRLFFYSNEHDQPHVHILKRPYEVSFWLEPEIDYKRLPAGVPAPIRKRMWKLAEQYREAVLQAWNEHFENRGNRREGVAVQEATENYSIGKIGDDGFELWVDDDVYWVSFVDYPEFLDATTVDILTCRRETPYHFWWPRLDVDIHLSTLPPL